MHHKKRNGGFSLIEVNLAILIAALGLLMLFQLFPIGLRQSVQSESDLKQTTFANALFEEINANMRGNFVRQGGTVEMLADPVIWNNPVEFWRYATEGMGLPSELGYNRLMTFRQLVDGDHIRSDNLKADLQKATIRPYDYMYFVIREDTEEYPRPNSFSTPRMRVPPQVIIRLRVVFNGNVKYITRRNPVTGVSEVVPCGDLPNSYIVSVASTDAPYPSFLHNRQVYSREFYYHRRP